MICRLLTIALSALLLTACGKDPQPTGRKTPNPHAGMSNPHAGMSGSMGVAMAGGPEVRVGSMVLTAPDGWIRQQPTANITLAVFGLPRADGDTDDGRLTVTEVGGSVENNMAFWRDQFDGQPTHESQETVDVAGTQVVLVDIRGSHNGANQTQTPAAEQPAYRVRAAIFTLAGKQFIVKCSGPEKTIAEREEEFIGFINSLSPPKPEAAKGEKSDAAEPTSDKPLAPNPTSPDPTSPDPTSPDPTSPDPTSPDPKPPGDEPPQPESPEPPSTEPKSGE